MKYLKFQPKSNIIHETRNRRELRTAAEIGYHITVLGTDKVKPGNAEFSDYKFVYDEMTVLTQDIPKAKRIQAILQDRARIIRKLRNLDVDIISCHNIDALWLVYRAFVFSKQKPKLIYDSHEFEIEKNANRNRFSKWLVKYLERFLMKRCAFSIMVNDSIADEVQHIHKLETRPVVVRSTPEYWKIDKSVIEQKRRELCETLGISEDTFIIMYHGGLLPNRGIETVIELVARNSNIAAIILGNGDETYESSLKALVADRGVKDFVLFHPAVSIDVLWQYVGAANVGMVILKNVCTNHYYSLPNKFFENIQSLTPIIGSNFPEISRIIDEYKIGLTCDPANIEMLNNCVEKMRCDKAFYDMCKEHLIVAKNDLCWENEKERLIEAYNVYFHK